MTCGFVLRWFIGLLACLALVAACSKDPCFPGSKGKQYRITIVERWDENSRFPGGSSSFSGCPGDLDLIPGTSFVIQIDSFSVEAQGCSCGKGPVVQAPDGWTWKEMGAVACGGNFFALSADGQKGACSAMVRVSVDTSRIPTGDEVPGEPPVAHLERIFQSNATTCDPVPTVCADSFVVEIAQL